MGKLFIVLFCIFVSLRNKPDLFLLLAAYLSFPSSYVPHLLINRKTKETVSV